MTLAPRRPAASRRAKTGSEPADQAARDLISIGGLDRTLFVEAGAGTGKTTQLVERISNLVLTEAVTLAEIAAITFTEAAATELRSRIRAHFEARLAQADDLLERECCRAALADADRAAISTLHGFASRLLGEFAVAAGLPPRLRVLDEVSSQLAAEERWQRFVDGLYADPEHEEMLVRCALVNIALEPRYLGQPSMRDVAARLNQNWDLLGAVAAQPVAELAPIDFAPLERATEALEAMLETCRSSEDKLYHRIVTVLLPEAQTIGALSADRKLRALYDVGDRWDKHVKRAGAKGNWIDVEAARAAALAVSAARDEIVRDVTDALLRRLLVLVSSFVLGGAEERRADGGLEFHDLLVLARNMLRTHPEARAGLHRRYRHLLLDEFQDTDPIQIELAVLIATAVEDPGQDRWSELAVPQGRLFFVGDPKQSIYRFRRADIELFLQARDRFGLDDGLARLTTNFRTVEPVLDWVNAFFGQAMEHEIDGRQPAYEPLVAHRRADSGADHRPLLLGGPHDDPKVPAGALRELEASDVARTVTDVLAHPERWPVWDEAERQWRPARLADITILLPARTSLSYLRDALDGVSVPYRLATGTLVYDTQEVRDVLAVLAAIDDPSDELSLVAALRSPLYACSDVDLFTYRQAGGRWDLRRSIPDGMDPAHPVAAALVHLRSLWERRWWLTPSAMVDKVLRERHAFLLAFGAVRPPDVWRRLRFLADQARAFEEAGGGGLRAFVAWAALQGADGARVHEPLLPETDEAAVQIMTIHGAKGLEFPITILSGMTTQAGGTRNGVSVLWGDDGVPELKLRRNLATRHHEPRADLEQEMDEHEKLRLLYVAATRARDHLVVSCHHKVTTAAPGKTAGRGSYAERIWTYFADHAVERCRWPSPALAAPPTPVPPVPPTAPVLPEPPVVAPGIELPESAGAPARPTAGPQPANHAAELAARDRWLAERAALVAGQGQPRVISATGIARAAAVGVAARPTDRSSTDVAPADAGGAAADEIDQDDDHADEPDPLVDGERPVVRRRGRTGSSVGRAVHATLQLLDLRAPSDIAALVRQQCAAEAIDDAADTVERLVGSALASDAVALASVAVHHKELYVAAPIGARVIEGYIDLLIETPTGLVIVDYKTDAVSSEADVDAKLDAYELQAAAYAVAVEQVTGQPVIDCRFVFCRPAGAIERSVRELPAAMAQVRHHVEHAV